MPGKIPIEDFLEQRPRLPVLDVRSPAEYNKGHIPGAVNIPLFDDTQRAEVGTIYVNEGRLNAVIKGIDLTAPQLSGKILEIDAFAKQRKILIYCWRGGMRSGSMAYLAGLAGIDSNTLSGGYKAYRNKGLHSLENPLKLLVLGGFTGSGKTEVLNALARHGEQVIDLEKIAGHKGSAFGNINREKQPTTEHFQNLIFDEWSKLDDTKRIWVEDESLDIGAVQLPEPLYHRMRISRLIFLDVAPAIRTRRLVNEYGHLDPVGLENAVGRLEKRLGTQNMISATKYIRAGDLTSAVEILLRYYDKGYNKTMGTRDLSDMITLEWSGTNTDEFVQSLLRRIDFT